MPEQTKNVPTVNELRMRYPFIVAHGDRMGSFQYYVEEQLWTAHYSQAPWDAVSYQRETNTWTTLSDYSRVDLRADYLRRAAGIVDAARDRF